MNDSPTGFTPLDPGRVNPMDPIEFEYWCVQLRCTPGSLQQGIDAVGEHVAALREWLERQPTPTGRR